VRYRAAVPERPPLAVLVSGAPGSGKSTLAHDLALGLDVPVLHKDSLVHGIWRTHARAFELGEAGIEPFYRTMELWLELGVSFVAEQAFRRGVSEPDVASRLAPRSVPVNVHCRSAHALERFERRMRDDPLCGDRRLQKLMPLAESLQAQLYEPLALSCPVVVVNTDDGYAPSLEGVISEIDALYSRPLVHELDRPASTTPTAQERSSSSP
jgi:hypothetical protein